eukprot:11525883-Alexandrium_andersonii.AAC.1
MLLRATPEKTREDVKLEPGEPVTFFNLLTKDAFETELQQSETVLDVSKMLQSDCRLPELPRIFFPHSTAPFGKKGAKVLACFKPGAKYGFQIDCCSS